MLCHLTFPEKGRELDFHQSCSLPCNSEVRSSSSSTSSPLPSRSSTAQHHVPTTDQLLLLLPDLRAVSASAVGPIAMCCEEFVCKDCRWPVPVMFKAHITWYCTVHKSARQARSWRWQLAVVIREWETRPLKP